MPDRRASAPVPPRDPAPGGVGSPERRGRDPTGHRDRPPRAALPAYAGRSRRRRRPRAPTSQDGMSSSPAPRPHILLIISDDHGYGDLSSRSSADARPPNPDRLAESGTRFDSAYVTAPICSPSRSGLIAGAHQQRWGGHWFDDSSFPPASQPVLPELLGAHGYRTGYFGKIHYGAEGPGDRACPEQHGFDSSFYGLTSTSSGRLHYLLHSREARERLGEQHQAVHGIS